MDTDVVVNHQLIDLYDLYIDTLYTIHYIYKVFNGIIGAADLLTPCLFLYLCALWVRPGHIYMFMDLCKGIPFGNAHKTGLHTVKGLWLNPE